MKSIDVLNLLNVTLLKFDTIPVKCDGHTLVTSLLLNRLNLDHSRVLGNAILNTGQNITPHFWIVCGPNTLDYRLRCWGRLTFSNPDTLPHGVFATESIPTCVNYTERAVVPAPELSDNVLDFMTDGYCSMIRKEIGI